MVRGIRPPSPRGSRRAAPPRVSGVNRALSLSRLPRGLAGLGAARSGGEIIISVFGGVGGGGGGWRTESAERATLPSSGSRRTRARPSSTTPTTPTPAPSATPPTRKVGGRGGAPPGPIDRRRLGGRRSPEERPGVLRVFLGSHDDHPSSDRLHAHFLLVPFANLYRPLVVAKNTFCRDTPTLGRVIRSDNLIYSVA